MRVGLYGRGRAARTLEPALRRAGLEIGWWCSRGDGVPVNTLARVDVVLLAVADDAIEEVAGILATRACSDRETWLHLSGFRPGVVARHAPSIPAAAGCFHPLQALPGFEVPATHLQGVVAGLDGDPLAVEAGTTIAQALGMRPIQLAEGTKPLYHAAAVTVAGHATALFSQAMTLMAHAGFSPRDARDALLPLMRGAVENLTEGLPAEVVTGPISRGDVQTVRAHLETLDAVAPKLAGVYRNLAQEALTLAASTLSPEAHDALHAALARPTATPEA